MPGGHTGGVSLTITNGTGTILFDRGEARNAMLCQRCN